MWLLHNPWVYCVCCFCWLLLMVYEFEIWTSSWANIEGIYWGVLSSERLCDVLLGSRNVISLAPHKFPFEISVQPKSLCLISPTLPLVQSSSPAVPMWAFAFRKSICPSCICGLPVLFYPMVFFSFSLLISPARSIFHVGSSCFIK